MLNCTFKSKYGITIEDRDKMVVEQGNKCAICGGSQMGERNLAIDHDHETGMVRALLCDNCNTALGSLNDSPELIRKAAEYVEFHRNG